MTIVFDPNVAYPSDRYGGEYQEFEGEAVEVEPWEPHAPGSCVADDDVRVVVELPNGERFTGYTKAPPPLGVTARIRIYNAGGGFYPDNQIQGWRQRPDPPSPPPTLFERL